MNATEKTYTIDVTVKPTEDLRHPWYARAKYKLHTVSANGARPGEAAGDAVRILIDVLESERRSGL